MRRGAAGRLRGYLLDSNVSPTLRISDRQAHATRADCSLGVPLVLCILRPSWPDVRVGYLNLAIPPYTWDRSKAMEGKNQLADSRFRPKL